MRCQRLADGAPSQEVFGGPYGRSRHACDTRLLSHSDVGADGVPFANDWVQVKGLWQAKKSDASGWVTLVAPAQEFQLVSVYLGVAGWRPSGTVWNASLHQNGAALSAIR